MVKKLEFWYSFIVHNNIKIAYCRSEIIAIFAVLTGIKKSGNSVLTTIRYNPL